MAKIEKLADVVDWRLCLGCGACDYICPNDQVQLFDFIEEGIRPVVDDTNCAGCRACLDVCPSVQSDFHTAKAETQSAEPLPAGYEEKWGPVVGMWEGHTRDEAQRFEASSGGLLTALATYCLEHENMYGTLHIAQDPADPVRNRTILSRTGAEIAAASGSRYSPASVCNGLHLVESAPTPCVVIGKPVEIAGVRNACQLRPQLKEKVGVTLSFFCAETPATRGTVALVEKLGADPKNLKELRYRGRGWPGNFVPIVRGEDTPRGQLTYQDSWAFLQAFRPWSIQLWPDRTGELADISCGDPWYEQPDGINPGSSIVVARTARGKQIVEGAIAAGYVTLSPAEPWKLERSQQGLADRKGAVLGRRFASRLLGLPVTHFRGLDLRPCWKPIPFVDKARATLGTARRIIVRGLRNRLVLDKPSALPITRPSDRAESPSQAR